MLPTGKARREQEIAGLKEALTILSGESLLQVKTTLRGARRVYARTSLLKRESRTGTASDYV